MMLSENKGNQTLRGVMRKAYKQAQGDVVEGNPSTEASAAAEGEDYY